MFKILGDGQDEIVEVNDSPTTKETEPPKSDVPNTHDHSKLQFGRDRTGQVFGQYQQSAPMIFTRDGHNMWFGDMYKGKSAFLILSGPSFGQILKGNSEEFGRPYRVLLNSPGFVTMSVNNAVSSFRTDMWVSNDSPSQFVRSVWDDPSIMKFCPWDNVSKPVFDSNEWDFTDVTPGDCPNTWFFRRNDKFEAEKFMYEDTFNWGSHKDYGGKRSVMLIAIRMLYYLGIRKVFLLGCDFKMNKDYTYHFEQARHDSSIRSNNSTYEALMERFGQLMPHFESLGFEVYNCNPESALSVFPYMSVDDALKSATDGFPNVETERTAGLYDREYLLRQEEKER